MGQESDGRIEITISQSKLNAKADFYPAVGKGHQLDPQLARSYVEAAGIVYGIKSDSILEAVSKCREENTVVHDVVIAEGLPPLDSIPEYYKLKKKFFEPNSLLNDLEKSHIDYKMVSPFIFVDKGEILGKKDPGREGKPGTDILGGEIPFGLQKMVQFQIGDNIEEKEGNLLALCAGCFNKNGNNIGINETLVIQSDVDYHTGHISFGGDVIIHGTIKDGFRVAAGGNVYCKKTLDASEILCKGDLLVEGGIIGRQTALVRVHGKIETRYIEYCDVESLKGVSVKSGILHSQVYTLGQLVLGEKSTIVGGLIYAEEGISVLNLGREGSPSPVLNSGISFVAERKLIHVKKQYERLMSDLERIRKLPATDKNLDLTAKVEEAMRNMDSHRVKILEEIYTAPQAEITAHGTVFPGTVIKICGCELVVKEKLNRVKFSYDPEAKRILTSNI